MNPSSQIQKHPRYRVQAEVDVVDDSAAMRRLPLENISLGGMFIRDPAPPAPGSVLRLRLHDALRSETLGVVARVVHVIDEPQSALKQHPTGMGVKYDGLSPATAEKLRAFVDTLVREAKLVQRRAGGVRFVGASTVEVSVGRALLRALWEQSLKMGGLFAEGASPPLGSRVEVLLGSLRLAAEVVQVLPGVGAGLQLVDFIGPTRQALERFVEGTAEDIHVDKAEVRGPPLAKVMAAARQLFAGLDATDGFAAIGVPPTADEAEVKKRVASLTRLFFGPHPDATPPQAARIEAALRALSRLEPALMARVAALRHHAELVPRPSAPVPDATELKEQLERATAAERIGDRIEARRLLTRALEMAPEREDIKKRLAQVQEALDNAKAAESLGQAEVFVQGLGMKDDAARLARQALQITQARELRLRALAVLAKAGAVDEAIGVAEELLLGDAQDALALQALMQLHEREEQWARAARAGEALLRVRPNDSELAKRVRRLVKAARG